MVEQIPDTLESSGPQLILIVDDELRMRRFIRMNLELEGYQVIEAENGIQALDQIRQFNPDLAVMDVMMPEMDGYMVLAHLRNDPSTRDIPVIFVTAMDTDEDEEKGISLGAVDYIAKPIRPAIVMARVKAHLELKKARDWLSDQNAWLENEVARRLRENLLMQDVSIRALANLAEVRDMETGNHIKRTQAYVQVLTGHLRLHPRFSGYLTTSMAQLIPKAAPLHDIGKVGIPDHILLKPARLTPEEFAIMKNHSAIGGDAIEAALRAEINDDEFQ
ncbi:MAG: response regulator, partial [Anaerolineae bacterium]|nr:response regulator [Anaerolineae bacterium]